MNVADDIARQREEEKRLRSAGTGWFKPVRKPRPKPLKQADVDKAVRDALDDILRDLAWKAKQEQDFGVRAGINAARSVVEGKRKG